MLLEGVDLSTKVASYLKVNKLVALKKIQKGRQKQRSGQHTLARQKNSIRSNGSQLHLSEMLDPDSHSSENLDPDLH
jgi:hypothetical protein